MQNAPRSGAFLLNRVDVVLRLDWFFGAREFFLLRAKRAITFEKNLSSLNLNAARQNFEAKKFLNLRRQNVRLFVG
ncbi:MAG: hypothetical protein RL544_2081 [Bacteroidota bacterium]